MISTVSGRWWGDKSDSLSSGHRLMRMTCPRAWRKNKPSKSCSDFHLTLSILAIAKMWTRCCCFVAKSCLTLLGPHGLQPARLLCPWDFPGKSTGVGCCFLLQGSPDPGIKPASAALAGGGFFTSEPPGKPGSGVKFKQVVWLAVSWFYLWNPQS